MKKLLSITATATLILSGFGAMAAELPTFELAGLPISPHQFSVVGSTYVQEQSPSVVELEPSRLGIPTLALTMGGMPASPLQIAVLTPRQIRAAAAGH